MLHNSVIGQNLNLTSCSFRAFRFAKRCRGGRGGLPLLGWSLRRFPPIPRSRGRGRFAARRLAWVINWAFRRARRLGVPFPSSFVGRPKPPSIVKRTDSHVGPLGLLGMTKDQDCHCEERSDAAIRSPVPKAPLCKGGRLRAPPVAEEASKKEWQWSKFCERLANKEFWVPQQELARRSRD